MNILRRNRFRSLFNEPSFHNKFYNEILENLRRTKSNFRTILENKILELSLEPSLELSFHFFFNQQVVLFFFNFISLSLSFNFVCCCLFVFVVVELVDDLGHQQPQHYLSTFLKQCFLNH